MRLGVERFLTEDPAPKAINPVPPETDNKPELKPIEGVKLPFDPQRDKARKVMAGLCDWVRQYGIGVYEVHYKDKLAIYWVVDEQEVKVYEVKYKQKDLNELEKEVRLMLGLVMKADRLMKEGYDRDLLVNLVMKAKETNGKVIFVDRNDRLEVYEGKRIVKTLHRG
ncbi:hypothetical protein IAE16_05225 [Hydrogenobacter sp. T-2]|uniref:hypothetical protein n=1 Tax=Pampinifervens diazotrophicum TaxID=1632018 RepID=UPI002B263561|nr:hypothetical protein [Hydrogenobacter sp. T-2]WPM31228.1 hypothetical protein IAE16_05225 [Hydrogenobacter sp. T-2]